jgi:uncharacterized membrane protein YjjP (DUF1212 family)
MKESQIFSLFFTSSNQNRMMNLGITNDGSIIYINILNKRMTIDEFEKYLKKINMEKKYKKAMKHLIKFLRLI